MDYLCLGVCKVLGVQRLFMLVRGKLCITCPRLWTQYVEKHTLEEVAI